MTPDRLPEGIAASGDRPTSISVREMRAGIVAQAIREHDRDLVLEDVAGLPRVSGWDPLILAAAIADLVADGRLEDTAYGHLRIEESR